LLARGLGLNRLWAHSLLPGKQRRQRRQAGNTGRQHRQAGNTGRQATQAGKINRAGGIDANCRDGVWPYTASSAQYKRSLDCLLGVLGSTVYGLTLCCLANNAGNAGRQAGNTGRQDKKAGWSSSRLSSQPQGLSGVSAQQAIVRSVAEGGPARGRAATGGRALSRARQRRATEPPARKGRRLGPCGSRSLPRLPALAAMRQRPASLPP
jgi:hypothetical protein